MSFQEYDDRMRHHECQAHKAEATGWPNRASGYSDAIRPDSYGVRRRHGVCDGARELEADPLACGVLARWRLRAIGNAVRKARPAYGLPCSSNFTKVGPIE